MRISRVLVPFLFATLTLRAANLIYFNDSDANRGLYNFNTLTGVATLRAPMPGTLRFFGMDVRPVDGIVFAVDLSDNSGLYRININTGAFSLVGLTGVREMVGVAFNPFGGELFGLRGGGGLYSLNETTGKATFIADTGIVDRGLAFSPSGELYGFTEQGALYRINPATAHTTAVGGSGNNVSSISEDAAFDAAGNLYGSDFGGGIYQTDPISGNGALIGLTHTDVLGMIAAPVPEPAVLELAAVAAIVCICRWAPARARLS